MVALEYQDTVRNQGITRPDLRECPDHVEDGLVNERDIAQFLMQPLSLFRRWPMAPDEKMGGVNKCFLPDDICDVVSAILNCAF